MENVTETALTKTAKNDLLEWLTPFEATEHILLLQRLAQQSKEWKAYKGSHQQNNVFLTTLCRVALYEYASEK